MDEDSTSFGLTDRVPRAVGTDLLNQRSITQRSDPNTDLADPLQMQQIARILVIDRYFLGTHSLNF
jgi:hypothetical protein